MIRRWRSGVVKAAAVAAVTLLGASGWAVAGNIAALPAGAVNHPVEVGPVGGETGFPVWYRDSNGVRLEGYDGVENYRTSRFPGRSGLAVEGFLAHMAWNDGGCPGCPNDCIKGFATDTSAATIERTRAERGGGLHQEAAGALGTNLGIGDVGAVLRLNDLCLRLGMDPVDFRMKNLVVDGDAMPNGSKHEELRGKETLQAAADAAIARYRCWQARHRHGGVAEGQAAPAQRLR